MDGDRVRTRTNRERRRPGRHHERRDDLLPRRVQADRDDHARAAHGRRRATRTRRSRAAAATTPACCRAPCRWSRRWPRSCWRTTRSGTKPSAPGHLARGTDGAPRRARDPRPVSGPRAAAAGFLGFVTGGHTVIHWFQQMFSVVLPSRQPGSRAERGPGGVPPVGAPARPAGHVNLPAGLLADSFARRQGVILGASLAVHGRRLLRLRRRVGARGARWWARRSSVSAPRSGTRPPWAGSRPGSPSAGPPRCRSTGRRDDRRHAHAVGGRRAPRDLRLARLAARPAPARHPGRASSCGGASRGHFAEPTARPSRADLVRDFRAILVNPVVPGDVLRQGLMNMARQVILTFFPLYIQIGLGRDAFELGVYLPCSTGWAPCPSRCWASCPTGWAARPCSCPRS